MSQLSENTINQLADTLVSDVIDYIQEDERLIDFYLEVIGDAVCEKLGNKNEDGTCSFDSGISSELIMAISERIMITTIPNDSSKDILSYFRNRNV
tara:strand:+ start:296 stop:583 length:288 start_codon:yes stop_codon:yes gene_type:complete